MLQIKLLLHAWVANSLILSLQSQQTCHVLLISTFQDQRYTWLTHKWLMWVTHIEAKYFTLVLIEFFQQKLS